MPVECEAVELLGMVEEPWLLDPEPELLGIVDDPELLGAGPELLGAVDEAELLGVEPELFGPFEVTELSWAELLEPGAELLLLDPQVQLLQPPLDLDEVEVGTGVVPLPLECKDGETLDVVEDL